MTTPRGLDDAFRDEQAEARVQRMWRGIEARRAANSSSRSFRALGLATVVGITAIAAVSIVLTSRPHGPAVLTRIDGSAIPSRLETNRTQSLVSLSDGSTLTLGPHSRLDVIEVSERAMGFALRRGRVRFSVTPHGPRRWRIDGGNVQVEVVGTVFTVERDARHVSVWVRRGAVVVRGVGVPDGVVRLGPGQSVHASEPHADSATNELPAVAPTPLPITEHGSHRSTSSRGAPRDEAFARALAGGEYDAAYDSIGASGLAARAERSHDVDELFDLADVARLSGHPASASAPLLRIIALFPSDPRAAMAAYTLGQIELTSLGQPGRAAGHFARSLELGLPRSARENASARLVEALARTGAPETQRAADEYLAAYPNGRYRAEVERWRAR